MELESEELTEISFCIISNDNIFRKKMQNTFFGTFLLKFGQK